MAVLGRVLISSAERVDLADLLSIDSYTAGDFKFLLKGLVGDTKPFILKGFDVIDPNNAIGTQSCSIKVADSMVFYPGSSTGSFYHGLEEGHAQAAPIVPELRKNATNFVYLTFSTFNSSVDTRAFWDPDKGGGAGGEFTQDVNTESVLKVDVNVSTGSFPANTIPIAKIVVGPVTIESITDCRDLMFRLGSGGISPDPFNSYQFRSLPGTGFKRTEPPITLLPGGVNPFQGADKNILSLKEWMDLVMTKLKEIGGSTYWYEDFSTYNLVNTFIDSLATTFKSKGSWTHDSSTPGLVTWTQDIQIKVTQDPRDIILRNGDKTLADEQVAYIPLIRAQVINASDSAVAFTNGQSYLNTVGGATGFFTNLSKGDWIKKIDDENHLFLRVEEFYDSVSLGGSTTTATNARSVRLNGIYQGTTLNEKARYDRGVYQVGDVVVSNRNDAALTTAGGNFHWLATRSDVIETAASLSTVTLTGTLSQPDGTTAKITSTAHGLQDGDRITITAPAAQAGTYVIEKETANIFYIPTTSLVTGAVTAFFGLVTTGARENGYGLQLENAVHEFETNDTVTIAGAVGYNGTYPISVRSSTQFQIAIGSAQATNVLATATATLARVNVRSEHGLVKIVQGGSATIGDGTSDNLKAFIGMASDGETYPAYAVPLSFDALDGMANYSALSTDSLTARASKLSAMMADKAQDKVIKYLASPSLITITNTTNGAAQEITFSSSGSTLTLITPGSDGQSIINLPSIAPGISLLTNESAYITIDRDNTTVPSIVIVSTELVPIAENIFVIASRLTDVEVYLWDSSIINVGSVQSQGFLDNVLRQNQMLKLVEGGTWSWTLGTQTVAWDASAFIQVPGLANTVNSIAAGSAVLATGEVAYVDINRFSPGGALTVVVASNATLTLKTDRIILARRENSDVIVGNHSMRLISGETKKIYAATSDQTFTYIGSPDASDTTPDYVDNVAYDFLNGQTNYNTANGESLTTRASRLTGMMADKAQDKTIKYLSSPSLTTITNTTNGAAQEITFSAGSPLTLMVPGSAGSATVTLPSVAPGISLLSNQAAYVVIDRDAATTPSIVIANISAVPIAENVFVIASRLTSVDVYLWDGAIYNLGASPAPGFLDDVIRQNQMLKLVEGGTWSWTLGTQTVAWGASAFIQVPGLANTVNSIAAGSAVLTSGQVAYVDINRVGPGGALTVVVASNAALTLFTDRIIIARRENSDVIVGNHSMRLISGETKKLYAATSDQTFTYMGSPDASDTTPDYVDNVAYDFLNGQTNYNTANGESLTTRASRLTGMMADKAQDKTVKYLASPSLTTITNTTNGAAQEITFTASGSTLTLITPGSSGTATITLPSVAPGISLSASQSAYVVIDRDIATTPTIVVALTSAVPIAENVFVIATRLATNDVYLWDSSIINVGSVQSQGFEDDDIRQNQMLKLVEGGTWSWTLGTQTVAWSASAFMQVPGLANTVNSIAAGSAILTSGQVAYVDINRVGPGGALTVAVASNATLTLTTDRIIIARRENNDVIVGNHSMRLISGETKKLYAATSDQTFTYMGSPDASDTAPDYNGAVAHTLRHITEGTSLTTGVARLDDQLDKLFGQLRMRQQTVANKRVIVTGADTTILDATTLSQQKSNLLLNFGGAQIDFETGSIFQSNGVTALGINFTPATIALNQYRWYSVTIIPSTVGSDNRIGGQILIIPAASDGASAALAPRASFGSGIKLGQVVVRNSGVASVITVILQTAITQLGSGSGGDDLPTPLKLSVPGNNRIITVGPITVNVPADKNYTIPSINNIVPTFTGGVVTVPATSGTITTPVLGLPFYTNLGTSFDDQIIQLAVQSNGKIVAGGIFLNLNGTSRKDLIRLEADGTVDTAFYTNLGTSFNDIVRTVAIQTDGKILAGGRFTSFNGATRNRLVRLNADGTQDTAFYTNLGTGFNIDMTSVVLQTNGKILVGGDFTTFNGNSRNRLVRLNSDGTEDTAFYTNLGTGFNGNLYKVAVQTDGKILVCGEFTTLNGNTRNRLVRLNSDGTHDTAFYSNLGTGFDNHVRTVVIQSDGKILVGGDYAILNGGDRNRLVRLEADGTEDVAFYSTLTSAGDASGFGVYDIKTIAVQTDGKILVGGDFVTLNGNTRNRLVRLNSDGTENTAFYTALGTGAFNNTVRDVVLQSDNRILVGGSFTTQGVNTRKVLVRLEANGTEDAGPPGFALPFAMGASQYLKIGLHLTSAGAVVLSRGIVGASLAAATTAPAIPNTFGIGYTVLRTDGSSNVSNILSDDVYQNLGNQVEIKAVSNRYKEIALSTDPNFYTALGTGFNDTEVLATAVQTDGKILVGGDFTTLNDITRNRLVRLNSDGTVDTTFYTNLGTGFNNGIQAIAVQTDGKILVGGQFTTFNGNTRNRLVRLNSDGTHDAAFYTNLGTGFDSDIRAIAIQIDGAIVVGGAFTTLNGNTRNYILRLNSDGTEDSAFYSNLPFGQGPNGPVRAIAIQTDGAIVVGGDFTQLFFFNRNYILRLNSDGTEDSAFYSSFSTAFDASVYTIKVQTDGKILVGGIFNILNGITRNRLVRLNTDGTEDTAFYTALGTGFNSSVYSIVLQTDGKILVGGGFTTLNAITRNVLVRLNSTGTVDTAFYTNLGTGFNLYARTITVQSNGKILFGGGFTTLNAITRNRLVRLNSDGTEDTTIAPFSALASTVLTLPKDTNSLVGTSVIASTVASSATVTITKVAHGLTTGDLVTVTTAVAIGGISAVNLSVTAVTIIALTTSTFTYTALATATTTTTGDLGRVIAKTTKSYIINDNSLEAYLNGILLYKGDEYSEIGAIGTQSNTVTALINFVAGDTLIFKIYD